LSDDLTTERSNAFEKAARQTTPADEAATERNRLLNSNPRLGALLSLFTLDGVAKPLK
jgi:hypothetical protein